MLRSRFPVSLLKGAIGLGLAVLLIAPVAVLWSVGPITDEDGQGNSRPIGVGGGPSNGYPPELLAVQLAFLQKSHRAMYDRTTPVWTPEMGSPRIGNVGIGQLYSPDTILLPMSKGAINSRRPAAVAESLRKSSNDPPGLRGDYFIAQLDLAAVSGKSNADLRKAVAGSGAEILEFIPNNAFLVRVRAKDQQTFKTSSLFSYVGAYEPAYKIHPALGRNKLYSPEKAASDKIDVVIRLHRGEGSADLEREIIHGGGSVASRNVLDNGQTVIEASIPSADVTRVARRDEVFQMTEVPQWKNLSLVTSIQTEMGRLIDPRENGGAFIRPFYAENIDGGGTYVTDPNQIPGCTPFSPATGSVDPNCYIVAPQFVGLVDNGIDLDSAALSNSTTRSCTGTTCDSTTLNVNPTTAVGATHRKVELYAKATDKDHNGVLDVCAGCGGEGDFLGCGDINSGGETHGAVEAGTMLGNPSGGQFGLGFFFEDADNSNQFASYYNDENEKNLPMDGQAPGARLLFIDAQGNGTPVDGPPPCATNRLSDVNVGSLVVDDVQALALRWDLNGIGFGVGAGGNYTNNGVLPARGARVIVLPFGSPTNFDNNIDNGQGTYAGNAQDIDRFLFNNRRVLTVVPVGNDGQDPNLGNDIDPFVQTNPNDVYNAQDIQVQDLATGKNIVSVGSNNTDSYQLSSNSGLDGTEFMAKFASKGPATFASGRIAPLVVAPGVDGTLGSGSREGGYSDDFLNSHAAIVSFDDDQTSGPSGTGPVELIRNQGRTGTSFSAAKVGGAAAQIRDYFAKGYYPKGIRGTGAAVKDVSGMLVKALLAGSTDFATGPPLIPDCTAKFCIQEGYGKVELANILPLKSYSSTRRPGNTSNLSLQPDTPTSIAVVDELWNGGLSGDQFSVLTGGTILNSHGFGVVPLGGRMEYKFKVDHGGASLRAFLAWYDKDGELLNNNLDLEIQDGDFDDTVGSFCSPAKGIGYGICGGIVDFSSAGDGSGCTPQPAACGNCQDVTGGYFDPTSKSPYIRRYLGNNFRDRQQFTHHAACNAGTPLTLDPASPNSQRDKTNSTEGVYLYYLNNGDATAGALTLSQGTGSSGFFKAIVTFPDDPAIIEVGAPNTPCVVCTGAGCPGDTVGATDSILTTADGLFYIGSGVDDPNTAGVDEAKCNSTAGSPSRQLIPNNSIGQPFGLVVTGPISYVGNRSTKVETDKGAYDCSDTAFGLEITEDTFPPPSAATVASRTTIQVLNASGTVLDTEASVALVNSPAANIFRTWRGQHFITSPALRLQYIGGLNPSRNPIANNGLIEVNDGQRLHVIYNDADAGDVSVSADAAVSCRPNIGDAFVGLTSENVKPKFVSGGCDVGRFRGGRGDFNFDAKERVTYQVFFTNHSSTHLNDLRATLTCQNPAGVNNPCQYLTIIDPIQNLGRVPFGREGAAAWNIKVAEALKAAVDGNTLPAAERVVLLNVTFTASNSDFAAGLSTQTFQYREALQADNERFFYNTDKPTGGKEFVDYNRNGLIETAELANGGAREEREIRTYSTWLGTTNNSLAISGGACGASPCIPFSFDNNNGGLTTRMAADSKPGAGYPASTQGFFYGTGGACGWQSQAGTLPASAKGVWHAGQGPIQSILSAGVCGSYVMPSDLSTSPKNEFVHWTLRSPEFKKVNTGTDVRGFLFDVRMEDLAWNSSEELLDAQAGMSAEVDTNLDDDGPVVLGDSYTYRPPFPSISGEANGPKTNSVNGARRFGPTTNPSGVFGDEVGQPAPLAAYDAGNIFQRPFLAWPATDSDGNAANGFTADERISTGGNCGPVPVGQPCRGGGFTTAAGPSRNRDPLDTGSGAFNGGTFEDFNGASGSRFQFELNWTLREGGAGAVGWTLDDLKFEWSEQHPADQLSFTTAADGGCSIDGTNGFPAGTQGVCGPTPANTCVGGPRASLFCRTGRNDDCRLVSTEGVCTTGTCTAGLLGKTPCSDQNDCDLGVCSSGNSEIGCAVDADCKLATNDCDAIHVRNVGSSAFTASQCASINVEKLFLYNCTSSLKATVQDDTPNLCGVGAGCTTSPRQVIVNARSAEFPLGTDFKLTETSSLSGVFTGEIQISASASQPGILFLQSNPGENVNLAFAYDDTDCDLDSDGQLREDDFTDNDGDGVKNFGADNVSADQDPVKTYIGGGKVSDDDNCQNIWNAVGVAQVDNNQDGTITAADCHVDPNHNKTGQCDFDDDGRGDVCDNCPRAADPAQLDTDADGIGNVCEDNDIDKDGELNNNDNCQTVYNPTQAQASGGGHGGSAFNRGVLCDATGTNGDFDGDGVDENVDNCPNEGLQENGSGGFFPGPCPGGTKACTYNPDQRDTDNDSVGDVCDSEDFDGDGVTNAIDNCRTVYNPADPALQAQADSDGDGRGDDRRGTDTVGVCQPGNANAGVRCLPVGTAANCVTGPPPNGTGAFCIQSADQYCDFDSTDDNFNGVPDDLIQFTTRIDCRNGGGIQGTPILDIANVQVAAVTVTDDGTADPVCRKLPGDGDPNPNNAPVLLDPCAHDPNGVPINTLCDTPPGTIHNGVCIHSPDSIMDPGETATVALSVANSTVTATNVARNLTNATIGIVPQSATIGCVPKATTLVRSLLNDGGTHPAPSGTCSVGGAQCENFGGVCATTGTCVRDPLLRFIVSTLTGQSTPTQAAEATFLVTVRADDIEGNDKAQTFKLTLDQDVTEFPTAPNACGGTKFGTALSGGHLTDAGALCEDFDTDRNGNGSFQFTRLYIAADPNDPLRGIGDPNDDVLGATVDSGAVPFGVNGLQCSDDRRVEANPTCQPVPTENDWHMHSKFEGCDPTYDPSPQFATSCAPEERAHSGFRSMHMGRHLNATDTLGDTYRMRQVSAFVMDQVNLGAATKLDFWQIMMVCDDKCSNAGVGGTFAGGQVQISLLNGGTGKFEKWQLISPTQNVYNSVAQNVVVICQFDPGDDQSPPLDQTMCTGLKGMWSDQGDVYGSDRTCTNDTDNNDPTDKDCGETSNRTVVTTCSWISDPNCGSFLENGTKGRGVWAREQFNLSSFSGRGARLRWITQTGGGWNFGESRSFLEPVPGAPIYANYHEFDAGWYIDDIRLTDMRTNPSAVIPDPTDGLSSCPTQGDTNNCGSINVVITGSATDVRTGGTVLRAQAGDLRTGINLDAGQSAADPSGGATPGGCASGVLQYQWSELDENLNPVRTIAPFSSKANITVAIDRDTSYKVDIRCSSDTGCTGSKVVQAQVYTGDDSELNSKNFFDAGKQAFRPLDGLEIDHDPNTNTATLTWRARPQVPGISGYDMFKRDWAAMGTASPTPADHNAGNDTFFNSQFANGVCLTPNNVPNTGAGTVISKADATMPVAKHASLYMIGHSSNNGLAISPLGFRPGNLAGTCDQVAGPTFHTCITGGKIGAACTTDPGCTLPISSRANTLVNAVVNCP